MVNSGVLAYVKPGEVLKNYTLGSGFDTNSDRQRDNFTTKLSRYKKSYTDNYCSWC